MCLVRIYIKGHILLKTHETIYHVLIYHDTDDLTTVSPVYSQDSVVHQRAASLILQVYSQTDPGVSGVRGLISELKPEQHNLHL